MIDIRHTLRYDYGKSDAPLEFATFLQQNLPNFYGLSA